MKSSGRFYFLGVVFALVWSSASVAAKIGLRTVQPFVLYQWRFVLAAFCMLTIVYLIQRKRLPKGKEWLQLALFGFLNVTLALGFFIIALDEVAAGVGALQVGLNPLVISIMSSLVARKRIAFKNYAALVVGLLGVGICVYPLLLNSFATLRGLIFLAISTLAYSGGAVYFSKINWQLEKLTINSWQSFFGALFLFPMTFLFLDDTNIYNSDFFRSVFWLGIPISVGAVFLWLWLLSQDTIRASFFLFLCPSFGLLYAYFFLEEPFTIETFIGMCVVMFALYIGRTKKKADPKYESAF